MHFIVFIFISLIDIQRNAGANKVVVVDTVSTSITALW